MKLVINDLFRLKSWPPAFVFWTELVARSSQHSWVVQHILCGERSPTMPPVGPDSPPEGSCGIPKLDKCIPPPVTLHHATFAST